MANQRLFQIGDVAKMFHISVGSLRHYENLGLLKPEKTDPQTDCVSARFRGSHDQSPAQYEKLMSYIQSNNLQAVDFSREITMIDYGITNNPEKFVTEINIPVRRMTNEQND